MADEKTKPGAQLLPSKYEMVPIQDLKPHPSNPRRGDLELVKDSILRNGFFGALLVQRSTGWVLAGNHRLLAARELGMSALPVIWLDVPDDEALRILLVDNRASDKATYDDEALAQLLNSLLVKDVADERAPLSGTGYDEADLAQLLTSLEPEDDWKPEDEWQDMPAFQNDSQRPAFQVLVSFQNLEDKLACAEKLGLTWTEKTKSAWWPHIEQHKVSHLRWRAEGDEEPARAPDEAPAAGEGEGA